MRSRTPRPLRVRDLNAAPASGLWFRQPIVCLGAAILLASIVGCLAMIVLATSYPDPPVATPRTDATR